MSHVNLLYTWMYRKLEYLSSATRGCSAPSLSNNGTCLCAVTTPVPISPSPDGEGCVPIPVGLSSSSSLEVVWPERHDTVGRLCYCPPFEGTLGLFTRCISTTSCRTDYSIAVRNNSVCFAEPSPQLTNIPVYFTVLESCAGNRCAIRSIVTSFMIVFGELTCSMPCHAVLVHCSCVHSPSPSSCGLLHQHESVFLEQAPSGVLPSDCD